MNVKTFGDVDQRSLEQLERCMAAGDAEFGTGVVDWKELFAAARTSGVKIGFVEQDPSSLQKSLASAKASFEYLRGLRY